MSKAEQFITLTKALDQCIVKRNMLNEKVTKIKAEYKGTPTQKAKLKALEQEYIKLNIETGILKQQAKKCNKK